MVSLRDRGKGRTGKIWACKGHVLEYPKLVTTDCQLINIYSNLDGDVDVVETHRVPLSPFALSKRCPLVQIFATSTIYSRLQDCGSRTLFRQGTHSARALHERDKHKIRSNITKS